MTKDDVSSLAHSKWNFKYHVVFCTKVQENSNSQANTSRYRKDITEVL